MKFNICFKYIKNMQFNGQILKIYNHVNLFSKNCSLKFVAKFYFIRFC